MQPAGNQQAISTDNAFGVSSRRVGMVAIAAVALGFIIQLLILLAKLLGDEFPTASRLVLDMTQGITWSVLICVGVGLINALAKLRPFLAGVLSMLIAPIAVGLAKGAQKVMAGLLSAAETEAVLSLSAAGALKGIEYGVLGYLLARAAQASASRLPTFLFIGLGVGLVFGGLITWLTHIAGQIGGVQVISTAINEILFPVGCAGIVYTSQMATQQAQALNTVSSASAAS